MWIARPAARPEILASFGAKISAFPARFGWSRGGPVSLARFRGRPRNDADLLPRRDRGRL